ncbi:ABC transporter permease [Leucobacter luti]|uniref:ABC transporter permease n=1 Tax=Leucobacter luti TaxID=340320 RepID=UPI001FB450F5|nr:ABC transporter permease [Leucobacter luti]MCW2289699.1 peptide/nickel transport system permease protein [Leucobacter luti]
MRKSGRGRAAVLATARVLGRVAPVMLGVVVAVFFLLRLVPGDPAAMILGERATPQALAALRAQLGLDLPLWQQFTDFLWGLITRFDTGDSLVTGVSTRELILAKAPVSLGIVAFAVVLAVIIAVPLAVTAALRQDGWADHLVRILPAVGMGMPLFWIGLLLIIVFGVQLRWFPVGGVGTGPGEPLLSLFLPALAVALGMAPPLIRSLRAQLIEVLAADFVTTLRAARIPERRILFRHVLRGAALPTLTLLSVNTAYLIGGTLVVEKVFGINGVGTLLFQSIGTRDFPVVQGVALYCAVLVVLVTTLAGVLSAVLDPRLRAAEALRGSDALAAGGVTAGGHSPDGAVR